MVAIVTGNSLGLSLTSAATLGQNGTVGSSASGRNGEQAFVNAANGNLVLQDQDEYFAARGSDLVGLRTYNSEGKLINGLTDSWAVGAMRQRLVPPTTWGSGTLVRVDNDAAEATYTWSASRACYYTTAGDGAYDTVTWDSANSQYVWIDGATAQVERFDSTGKLVKTVDPDGNEIAYGYDANGRLATTTGANGERIAYSYNAAGDIQDIKTSQSGGATTQRISYAYDASRRLTQVTVDLTPANTTDSSTYWTKYDYDGTSNRIAKAYQLDGSSLAFTYDGQQRVLTITDALSRVTTFDYSVASQTKMTDAAGMATVFKYDANGQLKQIDVSGQMDRMFGYDQTTGDVTSVTDGANKVTTFTYDARGNLLKKIDPLQDTVERTYNTLNYTTTNNGVTFTNTNNNTLATEIVYHAPGATPGNPSTTRYVYDAAHQNRVRFVVSPLGRVTEYQYNNSIYGERTSVLVYDGASYSGTMTDTALASWGAAQPADAVRRTDMAYTPQGQLWKATTYAAVDAAHAGLAANQSVTSYTYNTQGQLMSVLRPGGTGPTSGTTYYTYDGLGRQLTESDPYNQLTVTTYDDVGMKTTIKLANNLSTIKTYDKAGNLVSVLNTVLTTNPVQDLGTTKYTYDADNRLIMTTDPTGARTFRLYDTQGNLAGEVDGDGTLTEYLYDLDDRLSRTIKYTNAVVMTKLVDASGNALNPALDSNLRPAAVAATDQNSWRAYDDAGRLKKTVDGEGAVVEYFYDGASLVDHTIEYGTVLTSAQLTALGNAPAAAAITPGSANAADDRLTRNFYDADSLLIATLDGDGWLKAMAYDGAGTLAQATNYATLTNPADRTNGLLSTLQATASSGTGHEVTTYLRNGKGQVTGEIDPRNYLTEYSYDLAGRRTASTRYATKVTAAFTSASTVDSVRPALAPGQDVATSCVYDDLGRCTQETNEVGVISKHTYDVLGNLTQTITSFGLSTQRTALVRSYDPMGRLASEQNGEDIANGRPGIVHTYDLAGRRMTTTDRVGNKTLFFYDNDNRLVYTIDATGSVSETDYNTLNNKIADVHYQLPAALTGLGGGLITPLVAPTLSSAINALQRTGKDLRLDYKLLRNGQIASVSDGASTPNTTYYFYDAFGEPVYTVNGAGDVEYSKYDADGRLVQTTRYVKQVSGVTSTTTMAQLQSLIAAALSPNDVTLNRVYDMDGRLAATVNGIGDVERFWYDTNGNLVEHRVYAKRLTGWQPGNAINTVDDPADARLRTVYDPFGRATYTVDGNGAVVTFKYDQAGNVTERKAYANTISPTTATSSLPLNPTVVGTGQVDAVTTYTYDSENRLVWSVDAFGGVTRRIYDKNDNLTQLVQYATPVTPGTVVTGMTASPNKDRITNYIYDAAGRQIYSVDSLGTVVGTAYDKSGNVTQTTEYNATVAKPVLGSPTLTLSPTANATNDRTTRMAYDAANRLVLTVSAAGEVVENVYDGAGNVASIVRYANVIAVNTLNAAAQAATALGTTMIATQTAVALKALFTTSSTSNRTDTRLFDGADRLKSTTDALNHAHTYTYDGLARTSEERDKGTGVADRITTYTYDSSGRLYTAKDGLNAVETSLYDGAGNKTSFQNKKGATWTYTYDAAGRVKEETAPLVDVAATTETSYTAPVQVALKTTYAYDGRGNLLSRTEATGRPEQRITTYEYDGLDRQVRTRFPAVGVYSGETTTNLAANGQGSAAIRRDTSTALFSETYYDALGNATGSKDVGGAISYKGYDQVGRVQYDVDALGYVTEHGYGIFDEELTLKRYATKATVPVAQSLPAGFVPTADAANDRVLTNTFDKTGRVLTVTEPTGYTFDPEAAAGSQNPTASKKTTNTYDAFGEIVQVARASSGVSGTYNEYRYYDKAGNLSATVDAGKYITVFTYDGVGNLYSQKEYAKALTGTITSATQPTPVADAVNDRETTYAYDVLNRKLLEQRLNVAYTDQDTGVSGTATVITSYAYDAVGNITATTTADGTTYTYYDALGRVTAIAEPQRAGETSGSLIIPLTAYQRDAYGNAVLQVQYAKGASSALAAGYVAITDAKDRTSYMAYDAAGHKIAVRDANADMHYSSYDAYGHVAKEWQSLLDPLGDLTKTQTIFKAYSYDALGRLTRTVEPDSNTQVSGATVIAKTQATLSWDMTYNAFGELTGKGPTGSAADEKYDYDQAGHLWRTNSGDGIYKVYLYDTLGNRTSEITSTGVQALDGAGYSAAAAVADTSLRRTDYRYDALGRVIQQTLAKRSSDNSDVTVRGTSVGYTFTSPDPFWDTQGESSGYSWTDATVNLTWNPISNLGNGDVKVVLNYTSVFGGTTMDGPAMTQTALFTSDVAAAGATFTISTPWGNASGGVAHVDKITVYKKDINGNWVQVLYRNTAVTPPFVGSVLDIQRLSEAVVTDVQLWDTQAASPTWYSIVPTAPGSPPVWREFGDRYVVELAGYDPARYKYKVLATQVGGTSTTIATGFLSATGSIEAGSATVRPISTRTYDRWGNLASVTDPTGTGDVAANWTTSYTYDANNNVLTQTQPGAIVTSYGYDKRGRKVLDKDALNNVNRTRYDAGGNLIQEIHADGGIVNNSYDGFGQLTVRVDAESDKNVYAYDFSGRQTSVTHYGWQGTYGFDIYSVTKSGDSVTLGAVNPRVVLVETTAWDAAGRKLSTTNAANETIKYTYDLRGNITATTMPDGVVTSSSVFDSHDHKTAELDADNRMGKWSYDAFGRYATGAGLGHTDIGGATYTYSYDKAGQLTAQTNSRGQNLAYTYDAAGQLTKIVDAGTPNTIPNPKTTNYTWDLGGHKTSEKLTLGNPASVVQDTNMGYDSLGRLRWVGDSHANVNMYYDAVGNRTRVTTHVINAAGLTETTNDQDRYFKYDAMNRQTVVDGVDAAGNVGTTQGHQIAYDKNGNRISDTFWGTKVTSSAGAPTYDESGNVVSYGAATYTATQGWTKEVYRYDGQDRLRSIERDGMQIDRRLYDGAGRVVATGGADNLPSGFLIALYGADSFGKPNVGNGSERTISYYNPRGQLVEQQAIRTDQYGNDVNDYRVVNTNASGSNGYDAAGNLLTYRVIDDNSHVTNTYTNSLAYFEGYQQSGVSGTSTRLKPGSSTNTFDANGQLIGVTDATQSALTRTFINDPSGQIVATIQGNNIERQMIANGEVLGRYGSGMDGLPRNINGTPNFNTNIHDFALGYRSITPSYPNAAPGAYVVQTGDTLMKIAQSAFGDARRWYQIAQANGLSSDTDLKVGQTINIPNLVGGANNGSKDFQPYDSSKMVGDTAPYMAAPKPKTNWFGKLLAIIVTIIITIYTAGAFAASGIFGATASTAAGVASTGALAAGAGSFGATMAAGTAVLGGAAGAAGVAVAAAAGAVGSIAGQAVGIATGAQDGFSWKGVALGAISAGATAGIGSLATGTSLAGNTFGATVGRAVLSNVVSQGIGVVTGLQHSFDWKGVAASAAGAGVGQQIGQALNSAGAFNSLGDFGGQVARGTVSGFASGLTAAVVRGGKINVEQVAVDAFGNALGESMADVSAGNSDSGRTRRAQSLLSDLGINNRLGSKGEIITEHLEFDDDGLPTVREGNVTGRVVQSWLKEGYSSSKIVDALGSGSLTQAIRSFDFAEDATYRGYVIVGPLGGSLSSPDGSLAPSFATDELIPPSIAGKAKDVLAHVVDAASNLSDFAEEHPLLASMGLTAAQAAVTGGPIKQAVIQVVKTAAGEVLGLPNVYNVVQTSVSGYLQQELNLNPLVASLLGHGAGFATDFIIGSASNSISDANTIRNIVQKQGAQQKHHADPVFMKDGRRSGSDPMISIGTKTHEELHKDLNGYLKTRTDGKGNDMMPRRGNSGEDIRQNFTRDERIAAMREFYLKFESKYPTVAADFFRQHGRQ